MTLLLSGPEAWAWCRLQGGRGGGREEGGRREGGGGREGGREGGDRDKQLCLVSLS